MSNILCLGGEDRPTYAINGSIVQQIDTGKRAIALQVYRIKDGNGISFGDHVKDGECEEDPILQLVFCKKESLQSWKTIIEKAIPLFDELESLGKEATE